MKGILVLFLMVFCVHTAKSACVLANDSVAIKWTAFKTPAKVGVSGGFKLVEVKSQKGDDALGSLDGATAKIMTSSVNSKHSARDKKIFTFFFKSMKDGKEINAVVNKVNQKKSHLVLDITMNGITKKVPLKYVLSGNDFKAKGHIDILDFAMNGQLASLNKACLAKHQGKTWSDVSLELTAQINCQ
jgi:polyisoprenoid-binding protein YceI